MKADRLAIRRQLKKELEWTLLAVFFLAIGLHLPADAQRGPQQREHAPEIRVQILEKRLVEPGSSSAQSARIALDLALTLYEAGDFEREVEVLEEAIEAGIPNSRLAADAHYYLGRTYQALGQNEWAADEFDTVWRQYRDTRYAYHAALQLGDLMLGKGYDDMATEWYNVIISGKPRDGIAFLARDKIRDLAAGISVEEIIDESGRPVYFKDQIKRLNQYLYSRMYDKADELAGELIHTRENPALRAAMHHHMAHHYWMYGDVEGANRFVPEMLHVRGTRRISALILAGHIKRALGERDEAIDYYAEAIELAPDHSITVSAYQQSVRLLLRQGRASEALALAARGRNEYARHTKLSAYLDRVSNTLRASAHPEWRHYAELVSQTSVTHRGYQALQKLARDARLRNDWEQAEEFNRRLVARDGTNDRHGIDTRMALLTSLLQQGKASESAVLVRSWVRHLESQAGEADRPYGLYRLGRTLYSAGQAEAAETYWRQAVEQYPHSRYAAMAQVNLARSFEERGSLEEALEAWEEYLRMSESEPRFALRAYAQLIRLNHELGRGEGTLDLLSQAQLLAAQARDAELQLNLAQYYLRQGLRELGREMLERGVEDADAHLKTVDDDNERLWWEYLIARRLQDFRAHGRIAERLSGVEMELLQNPALNDDLRFLCYFAYIRAMEYSGQWREAEAAAVRAVESMPAGSRRLGDIAYRVYEQARARADNVSVREWATVAFNELPTDHLAQYMFLQLAVEDFNDARLDEALDKVTRLEKAVPMSQRPGWAEHFRWDIAYLKGRSLSAMGQEMDGGRLMEEALRNKPRMVLPLTLQNVQGSHEP